MEKAVRPTRAMTKVTIAIVPGSMISGGGCSVSLQLNKNLMGAIALHLYLQTDGRI